MYISQDLIAVICVCLKKQEQLGQMLEYWSLDQERHKVESMHMPLVLEHIY